ncbi:MAG TPA: hypothetical protein PLI09_07130 [Candidatus Hydrogenedentes bacterium]|nr:hypothetical protein [Candidatus Hydrogenedentota bacterium]
MDLLAISAAGLAIRETAKLISEFRQSRTVKRQFESALAKALENSTSTGKTAKTSKQRYDLQSSEFIRLRDVNGNGMLSRAESGFDKTIFNRVDSNSDGQLSRDELIAYFKTQA